MRVLYVLLALLPLWPIPWALRHRALYVRYPRLARILLSGAVAAGLALAVAARWWPAALPTLAGLGLLAALAQFWHARPGHGAGRGLPPGSLRPLQAEAIFDASYFERAAARFGRVFKYRHFQRPGIAIVDLPLGLALLREHAARLRYPETPAHRRIPGGFLRSLPPDEHRAMRRALIALFTPEWVEGGRTTMEAVAREETARLAAAGVVHPQAAAHDFTFRLALRMFVDLDAGDPGVARWRTLYEQLAGPGGDSAYAELEQLWEARARTLPADSSCALATSLRAGMDGVDSAALRGNLIHILLAAWRDTGGLMDWIAYHLSGAPEYLARVRAENGGGDLVDRLVSECLRLSQSEFIDRRVLESFQFAGFHFPAGWRVRICVRECHRDPRIYPDPLRIDPDRFSRGLPPPEQFTPMGAFSHACLGEQLARAAGQAWIRALAAYQVERIADAPPELGPFHHWAPGPGFRIALRPLPALTRPGS